MVEAATLCSRMRSAFSWYWRARALPPLEPPKARGQRKIAATPLIPRAGFRPFDLLEALRDLAAGDLHVLGVLVRLADVIGELLHALVETLEIDAELSKLLLDDVDMPARFHVLQHRARGVQHRHQRGRRDDPPA